MQQLKQLTAGRSALNIIYNMDKKTLFAALLAVAGNNPDGFTVSAQTLQDVTKGYAVAVSGTQNSFGDSGLRFVIDYVAKHPEINAFGGWMDSESGLFYWDATIITNNIEQARALAIANKQIAFFDLENLCEIRL